VGVIPERQRTLLRLLAVRLVPESAGLTLAQHDDLLAVVEHALADRPVGMQRQFRGFLGLLRWAPIVRYGCRLDSLTPSRQDAVLGWFQDCPVQMLRSGFWGVRTLVMMGYYTRPEVMAAIGYHPEADGNAVLHARDRR